MYRVLALLAGCNSGFDLVGEPMCGNQLRQDLASPDGEHRAIAFVRDCGATTSHSPQVWLGDADAALAPSTIGNVYRGDRSDQITIAWLAGDRLQITTDARVLVHVATFDGVAIELAR
jgi:hypothetical protein